VQLGFSFDVKRCSGCMACVVACMDQNDLPDHSPSFRHVACLESGADQGAKMHFLSLACLHCGEAPCVEVCPTGALFKREEDGIVHVREDLCIGCRSCGDACPFGAPRFLENGKMAKCHLCLERVTRGLEPACVRTCPARALGFGPVNRLAAEKADRASRVMLKSLLIPSDGLP